MSPYFEELYSTDLLETDTAVAEEEIQSAWYNRMTDYSMMSSVTSVCWTVAISF
jgi:hypothetical protein